MKTFSFEDIEIRYSVVGESGPIYLMLHGFGGGPNDWQKFADVMSGRYRVVMPNLKHFFSHSSPITFSRQIDFLERFVRELFIRKEANDINLMGQSYGATLSVGLRLVSKITVQQHVLVNPMPFHPLDQVNDPYVKVLINFGYIPKGVNMYLATEQGRRCLEELAKIFRIGSLGLHEVRHMNDRKRLLVVKAFDRFRWIDKNENWGLWEDRLHKLEENAISHVIYSSHDRLYKSDHYKKAAHKFKAREIHQVEHEGHLLVQDKPEKCMEYLGYGEQQNYSGGTK